MIACFKRLFLRRMEHKVLASSFADPADGAAYRRHKSLAEGDNGVGCWGDDCTGPIPMCALPPDDMIEKWGTINGAKHKKVIVTHNGDSVQCVLADRMPWKKNITNGAGIDLSPAAASCLRLKPPFMVPVTWRWLD